MSLSSHFPRRSGDGRDEQPIRYLAIVAWCAILLGMLFRVTQLPTRTLYNDEGYTQLRVAGHTAADMIRALYDGRPFTSSRLTQATTVDATSSAAKLTASLIAEDSQHPPLFYFAELMLVKAFGNALIVWRLLPLTFGLLAIVAAYALARELFKNASVGLIAASLFAVSPIERIYSDQAREYSLFTLLVLITTLALARAIRIKTGWSWFLYALLATTGLYTNPFMAYVLAGHTVFAIGFARRSLRITLVPFVAAIGSALVAYIPWVYELALHRADIAQTNVWSATRWPFTKLLAKWIFNTGATFFDLEYMDLRWLLVFIPVVMIAITAIVRGFLAADNEARWCFGATIVIPALLLTVPDMLLQQHRSSVARYGLSVFALLTIITARGFVRRPFALSAILGAGLLSCAVSSLHPTWWDNDTNADDAHIGQIINSVPRAQVISTIPPPLLVNIARYIDSDVRISLSPDLSKAQFSSRDPLFVLKPTRADLEALRKRSGLTFQPVSYKRTVTAHDMQALAIGDEPPQTTDLYRASESGANHRP